MPKRNGTLTPTDKTFRLENSTVSAFLPTYEMRSESTYLISQAQPAEREEKQV